MQRKKWRDLWTDQEVRQMLHIMKKSHFAKLLDNSTETSVEIYEDLSREMSKYKMNRTARQIRDKFNALWLDYVKLEKTKDYSKASRHTNEHFDLLDAIFGRTSAKTTMSTNEVTLQDPLTVDEIKPEAIEIIDDSDEEMADDITLNNDTTTDVEESNDYDSDDYDDEDVTEDLSEERNENPATITDNSVHTDRNCQGYEKVVASFTKDWKSSQRALIEDLKRQDLRDLRTISKQFKFQETMLRKSRLELEKTLEKDRAELKTLLDSFLTARNSDVKHSQTNGIETEHKVKEEVEQTE